jgi:hypothetical protein
MDKLIEVLRIIDSPFKLAAVVVLALLGGIGYLGYHLRDDIGAALREHPVLRSQNEIVGAAKALLRDTTAVAIVVHEIHIARNERITRLALAKDGSQSGELSGYTVSLFNDGRNARNKATIAMLRGEAYCAPFRSSSKAGRYMSYHRVKYMCRAPIGPVGQMHGYAAVGFPEEPSDLASAKARILIATREMCR